MEAPEPASGTVREFLEASRTHFALAVPIEDAMELVEVWTAE